MAARPIRLREKLKLQTRIEIIRTALGLFAERGFANVPVEAICEKAGVSRATFFNYFPQKELVLAEFATERVERARRILAGVEAHPGPATSAEVIALFVSFAQENERLGPNIRELIGFLLASSACRDAMLGLRRQMVDIVARVLARAHAAGGLPVDARPRTIAEAIFALYIGTTLEWVFDNSRRKGWLPRTLRARLRLLFDGAERDPNA